MLPWGLFTFAPRAQSHRVFAQRSFAHWQRRHNEIVSSFFLMCFWWCEFVEESFRLYLPIGRLSVHTPYWHTDTNAKCKSSELENIYRLELMTSTPSNIFPLATSFRTLNLWSWIRSGLVSSTAIPDTHSLPLFCCFTCKYPFVWQKLVVVAIFFNLILFFCLFTFVGIKNEPTTSRENVAQKKQLQHLITSNSVDYIHSTATVWHDNGMMDRREREQKSEMAESQENVHSLVQGFEPEIIIKNECAREMSQVAAALGRTELDGTKT